ncbi:MAG: hypothetical protein ABI665_00150 [Vicinamibacterales bacterium]
MAPTVQLLLDRFIAKLLENMERDNDSDYGAVSAVRMAIEHLTSAELSRELNLSQRQALWSGIQDLDMGSDGEDLELGKEGLIDLIRGL